MHTSEWNLPIKSKMYWHDCQAFTVGLFTKLYFK